MNQLILVGRLTSDPILEDNEGKKNCNITLAVKRNYKNSDGVYETDFIQCKLWRGVAERTCEYCKKGDLVSVKGCIQNNNYTDKEGKKVYSYEIVAEKVAFMQCQEKDQTVEER